MKTSVLRRELFQLLIRPLTYISAAVLVLTVNLLFFVTSGFFVEGQGSSEIRTLFALIPYVCIICIPALTMESGSSETDSSRMLPVSALKLALCKWTAAFIVFLASLLFTFPALLVVHMFGDVNWQQVITGYSGIMLYGAATIAMTCFLAHSLQNRILAFFVSAAVLFLFTVSDLLPLAINMPGFLVDVLNEISFSWHFDAAAKGIFDTTDIFFYVTLTVLFIILSSGTRLSLLYCCAALIILIDTSLYSTRIDITEDRMFSVSESSSATLQDLASPLEITYYLSSDLEKMYPQIRDVKDFLYSYAKESKHITLTILDPEKRNVSDRLESLGIQSQQLQSTEENRTSFVNVYSSILLEYEGSAAIVPFVISTATLEFDLTSRLQSLISGCQTAVYVVVGNGLSLDAEYVYVAPWLESAGFSVQQVLPSQLDELENRNGKDVLLVLGSASFTEEDSDAVERWVMKGYPAFVATAPYLADITSSWQVEPTTHDTLIPLLEAWGAEPRQAVLLDLSNYRLRMYSSSNSSHSVYLNYPYWIVCLPQNAASHHLITESFEGLETYWASPLKLSDEHEGLTVTPLLCTTSSAWLTEPDETKETPYVTNPFITENLSPDASTQGQYVLAAALEGTVQGYHQAGTGTEVRLIVSGDQYFPSTLIENTNSPHNLDFLTDSLLWLSGKDGMLSIKHKGTQITTLYKLSSGDEFAEASKISLVILFGAVPFMMLLLALLSVIIRKNRSELLLKELLRHKEPADDGRKEDAHDRP